MLKIWTGQNFCIIIAKELNDLYLKKTYPKVIKQLKKLNVKRIINLWQNFLYYLLY